uniref:Putative ixostatin n=1 Tax=Ixodes ricinus TaxID=34613 RepID=A0A0K8R5X2_IXORI
MILPLLVVVLATSGYSHASQEPKEAANKCSPGLGDHIARVCSNFGSTLTQFSDCTYTCHYPRTESQTSWTKHKLPDGLPCGKCRQCCNGICTPINFDFVNPLSLKSCANKKTAAVRYP